MGRDMNLLLIGERYSENLGDGMIFEMVERLLHEIYPEAKIKTLDLSGLTGYQQKVKDSTLGVKVINKLIKSIYLREYFRTREMRHNLSKIDLNKIDHAIVVGGQMFMEYFSFPLYFVVNKLNRHDVPVIFNCCGIGKNQKIAYQRALKSAINQKNVRAVSIRDGQDIFFKMYGKEGEDVPITLDPVFELEKYISPIKKRPQVVGIGVMSREWINRNGNDLTEEQYLNMMKNSIEMIEAKGMDWRFFTNGSGLDVRYAQHLQEKLGISGRIDPQPTTPDELIQLVGGYDRILAFRMHTHIIANALGTPTVGYIWDEKMRYFAQITQNDHFIELDECVATQTQKQMAWLLTTNAKSCPPEGYKSSEFLRQLALKKRGVD